MKSNKKKKIRNFIIREVVKRDKTYESVANLLGLTRQRIHQIMKSIDYKNPNLHRKYGKMVKCAYCGKEVYKTRTILKLNHKHYFCNKQCYSLFGHQELKCKTCGKLFDRYRSCRCYRRDDEEYNTYCSRKCFLNRIKLDKLYVMC